MYHLFLLTCAFLTGAALSVIFFGGLWLTVQALDRSSRPWLLMFNSFVGRMTIVTSGFYLVLVFIGGRLEVLVVCLLGFLVGRILLVRRWRPKPA